MKADRDESRTCPWAECWVVKKVSLSEEYWSLSEVSIATSQPETQRGLRLLRLLGSLELFCSDNVNWARPALDLKGVSSSSLLLISHFLGPFSPWTQSRKTEGWKLSAACCKHRERALAYLWQCYFCPVTGSHPSSPAWLPGDALVFRGKSLVLTESLN